MTEAARARPPLGPAILAVILVFTLASTLAVNPYYFGLDDNSISIPFLKASVNPALYPGDYLIAQRAFYYTFLWDALGQLQHNLGISLPALFFAGYLVALYFTFLGTYLIAFSLFGSREVAVVSMLFLLFSKSTLAGVHTLEQMLNTREAATPLLLLAIYFFLERRAVLPFVLLGLAYLVHPLTAHYVLAMLLVAALVESRARGLRWLAIGVPAFVVLASPILVWRLRSSPPSLRLFSADPEWLAALRVRSPHHMFPLSWGWEPFALAALTALLFGIGWRHRSDDGHEERHRAILSAFWTILALCAIGVVGSEGYPMGVVFQTQPPRAFQFAEYFAMIYVAHYLCRQLELADRPAPALRALAAAGGIAFGQERQPLPGLAYLAIVLVAVVRRRLGRGRQPGTLAPILPAATCLAGIAAVACLGLDRWSGETTFPMLAGEPSPFVDVQHWARTHTDVRDGFIVPPYEQQEFRVFGERTVYGDIEDGGLMNSNPAFGREWLRRMGMLDLTDPRPAWEGDARSRSDFARLEAPRVRMIAREMVTTNRRVFLVWPSDGRPLPFVERFRNAGYIVYQVD